MRKVTIIIETDDEVTTFELTPAPAYSDPKQTTKQLRLDFPIIFKEQDLAMVYTMQQAQLITSCSVPGHPAGVVHPDATVFYCSGCDETFDVVQKVN